MSGVGDFSSAASVDFQFYERLDERILQVSLGEDAYQHLLLAGSYEFDDAQERVLTAAAEVTLNNGPWDLDEDLGMMNHETI